ncbi:hypothetical protein N309_15254, partial [Tinamus guttatus]
RSSPAALRASCNELSRGAGHRHRYVQQESTLMWYPETSCSGGKIYSFFFPIWFQKTAAFPLSLPTPPTKEKKNCNQNQKSKPPELDSFPFWKCSA